MKKRFKLIIATAIILVCLTVGSTIAVALSDTTSSEANIPSEATVDEVITTTVVETTIAETTTTVATEPETEAPVERVETEADSAEQNYYYPTEGEYPVATYIWNYLQGLGYNDYVCAGIMGNLMIETGGYTLNLDPYAYGGDYYGICQWSAYYCPGIQGADLDTQLNYLANTIEYEINVYGFNYSSTMDYDEFLQMTDAGEAAKVFGQCYERGAGSDVRAECAYAAYAYFVG